MCICNESDVLSVVGASVFMCVCMGCVRVVSHKQTNIVHKQNDYTAACGKEKKRAREQAARKTRRKKGGRKERRGLQKINVPCVCDVKKRNKTMRGGREVVPRKKNKRKKRRLTVFGKWKALTCGLGGLLFVVVPGIPVRHTHTLQFVL